ncbi:MAG TPA: alpha/beta fold hydrolase [Blastocatellia bacterium]|nr:alpha/beta fold hydrolase [Blastocatellia bacterium]
MNVDINGTSFSYKDEGTGQVLLLIHAFPLNQAMWDEQMAVLSSSYRVVSIDLRGFGGSELPSPAYSVDDMAADVKGLLDVLGISSVVLVGLSMGGYVSMSFYRNYPARVRALVLADTRATPDSEQARMRRLKSAEQSERDGTQSITQEMVRVLLGRTTLSTRPDIVERVRTIMNTNQPAGIAAAQRAMADRQDSTDLLETPGIPVLLIFGEEDSLVPLSEARELEKGIGGSTLRIIEGAGHLSNLEQPSRFNDAISEFLASLVSKNL